MISMNFYELSELWTRHVEHADNRTMLAAAAVGLAVVWRILSWQQRTRIERRLQAAAAAYAARELCRDTGYSESRAQSGSRLAMESRNLISRSEMTVL